MILRSLLAMGLVAPLFFSAQALAQTLPEENAVESARESLGGAADFPWYDKQADDLRRIDVKAPADLKNRKSKWEAAPAPTWSMPDWLATMFEVLGWTLVVAAIATVIYLLVRAFLFAEQKSAQVSSSGEGTPTAGDVARVESLPFQLKRPQSDLLAEARRLYEAGNFSDAIIYYYSYLLVELDKHQFIRLAKGKTNRQYLREVRRRNELWDLLQRTMISFEDVFFGHHALARSQFEACWSGLDMFQRHLEQAAS